MMKHLTLHRTARHAALALALGALHATAFAVDTPIYTLQGSGNTSAFVGQPPVTTVGIVTRVNSNGFFLQDELGDGNPATSDGIFVFGTNAAAVVGAKLRVTGTVVEFNTGAATNANTLANPLTEITSVTSVTSLGTGFTITPTVVSLPLPEGQTLEPYEGMLVRFTGPLTVQQNYFQARYGQLTIGAGGRHQIPTNQYRPNTPQAIALAALQARARFLLDDGSTAQNRNPTPYAGPNGLPRAGDTVAELTGTIDFGLATASNAEFGLYKLHPTVEPVFSVTNPRPPAPAEVGGNIRVASLNVLNYFTTFTNGNTASGQTGQGCTLDGAVSASNCRGANNITEFQRQQTKTVLALAGLNADAVGLMEIQNNGNTAAQNLVDALNAQVGAGTYATVAVPAQGTGTDAIRVAMIYKPARLALVGASVSDPAAINNRPTLAQTFQLANGLRVTLVVNHFKSKGSCPAAGDPNADQGDGQGCWNATRVQQAQQLRAFVGQLQASSGTTDVMIVGDLNAYAKEDPMFDLTSNGYVDQLGRFDPLAYSYVFDGASGRLDQALASTSLSAKVVHAVDWHINADESLAQDYNQEFKQPACATCAPDPYDGTVPYRSSDHDPVLVGLDLFKRIEGTVNRDTLTGTPGDDLFMGGSNTDTMTGGSGVNIYAYTSVRDAADIITDFVPGKDMLDVRALLASMGYAGSEPVADGRIRFVAIPGATQVQYDTDGPGPGAPRPLVTLNGVSPASLQAQRDLIVD